MFIEGSNKNNISGNTVFNNKEGIYLYNSNESKMNGNNVSYNNHGFVLYYSNMNNLTNNNASNNDVSGIGLYSSFGNRLNKNIMIEDSIHIEGDLIEHWNTHIIDTSNMVNHNPIYYLKNQANGAVPQNAGEIILANCTNITIDNQELHNGTDGILLGFSSNIIIISNNISFNYLYGIYISHSANNTLVNNNIYSNERYGIYFIYSIENNITSNNVRWNKLAGISLEDSQGNMIYRNNVQYNTQMNVWLHSSSDNNTISHNNISYYSVGIAFWSSSSYNNIIYNIVSNNFHGIQLIQSSNNNSYHHNNFINNQNQIYLEASCSDNVWDDSFGKGNFWSDYYGIDNGSGGRTADDGVGDTEIPHPFIDQSNGYYQLDNYPLMNPVGNVIVLYEGWNLISIPLIQNYDSLESVLSSISGLYDAVQWFNITNINKPWTHNKIGKPFGNDLFKLNEAMGFWIHIIQPGATILHYNGIQPLVNQTITLHQGWNLVGYPSLSNKNRTEALNNLTFGSDVDAIWTHNATTQTWKEITASDNFEVGRGYWMHSKVTKTWIVPL
jgi:parallel beta-helix repeat protein